MKMKHKKKWSGIGAGCVYFLVAAVAQGQTTWHVNNAPGSNCCQPPSCPGTQALPFCDTQDGINAATNGDTVLVHPGIYNEDLEFDRGSSDDEGITVTSTDLNRPDLTVVDGTGVGLNSTVRFDGNLSRNTKLMGFTITGGSGGTGSGIRCTGSASPDIGFNVITGNNSTTKGGGIFLDGSSARIRDCTICQNTTTFTGGGIYTEGTSNIEITRCTIEGNRALGDPGLGDGGGLRLKGDGTVNIVNCIITGNYAENFGGGIMTKTVGLLTSGGGGACSTQSCSSPLVVRLSNCLVFGNNAGQKGGGMTLGGCTWSGIVNTTVADNYAFVAAGGIYNFFSCVSIANSILWFDKACAGDGDELTLEGSSIVTVSYSDVEGGQAGVDDTFGTLTWGSGNIASDPQFCGALIGDYHAALGSPVIDAGDNASVPVDTNDLDDDGNIKEKVPWDLDGTNSIRVDGNPAVVDMGAYESHGTACGPTALPPKCACPAASITQTDPPGGTIDARQPHPIADSDFCSRQGIGSPNGTPEPIQITLGVSGADFLTCWSLCETGVEQVDPLTPPLDANRIVKVTETSSGSGVYDILLERPISGGHWTTITYEGGGSYVVYASLPADSNGDQTSSSLDILALIDCCLNQICTPPYGNYSCDIDHSGAVGSTDIFRLIDLLNGAQTYIVWNGVTLPSNTCAGSASSQSGSLPQSLVSTEKMNAWFADWFVDYVTTTKLSGDAEQAEFRAIIAALTQWMVAHFSVDERAELARRLADPSLVFADADAAVISRSIVTALGG